MDLKQSNLDRKKVAEIREEWKDTRIYYVTKWF